MIIGTLDLSGLETSLKKWTLYPATPAAQVSKRMQEAKVVVSNKVKLTAETIHSANKLQLICVAATGTNNVDLEAARARGVQVCNVRAYAKPSLTQHVFALMLSLLRHLPEYQSAVARGDWQKSNTFCLLDYSITELNGKTLGIIGYGELGQAVAAMARAFDMQVLIAQRDHHDRRQGRVSLTNLLKQVDVLSLHCPLTPETQNLIAEEQLALMKPSAIIINTERGGIVNEVALVRALREGRLAGAGIDVLSQEPPPDDHPLLAKDIPNLIVTPHIAWASQVSRPLTAMESEAKADSPR